MKIMPSAITVENLSKRYIIGHQRQERYTALRDVMADAVRRGIKKLLPHSHGGNADPTHEEFWALKDVGFEIQQGDRVGIIGRNGAGKSTLLKILSRITEPTSGRVKIKGRVASLLEVGTGFHPELTGRENIFLNGAILGMSNMEIKKKFDEIVAFAEVEKFLDTPVKRYSSGMYVRLAFAVAAHLEPEILIIDEVLAVGDAQFQKKCMRKMEQVGQEGRTVLFVSHNLGSIRSLCSRAVLLIDGMIAADGVPDRVINEYLADKNSRKYIAEAETGNAILQNDTAMVTKVEILNEDGLLLDSISTDTTFDVAIYYTTKRDGVTVGLNLVVYDSENNCVFGSINNHETNWYGKPMPSGSFKSVCQIPKNFFNNGIYRIKIVLFGKGFSEPVISQEILTIEIQDGLEVRGDYYGIYASCTRPLFNWITEKEDYLL